MSPEAYHLELGDKLLVSPKVMYQSHRSFNIPSPPHPPRAYPGHLTSFPAREEFYLWAGHLITTHRGWGIRSLASLRVALIPRGVNHGGEFKTKDIKFVADWLKGKGLQK